MFGLAFEKAPPTTHVIHYAGGTVRREGAGLAFWYWAPTATILEVPLATTTVPFVFFDTTKDFQAVTVQGQLTFRVADPLRLAKALDYSVRPGRGYRSSDPTKLNERMVEALQVSARAAIAQMSLRDVLAAGQGLAAQLLAGLRGSDVVRALGTEVLDVSVLGAKPNPDTARALEAEAREALLRQADEAIYARRNAAVAEERTIKESELNTQIAVANKEREIREAQMAGEISVEQQRSELIAKKAENDRTEADSRAYALEATLKPVRDVDWRTLAAVSGGMDPQASIALAFRELAANADKIGEVNISPDLLQALIGRTAK